MVDWAPNQFFVGEIPHNIEMTAGDGNKVLLLNPVNNIYSLKIQCNATD